MNRLLRRFVCRKGHDWAVDYHYRGQGAAYESTRWKCRRCGKQMLDYRFTSDGHGGWIEPPAPTHIAIEAWF